MHVVSYAARSGIVTEPRASIASGERAVAVCGYGEEIEKRGTYAAHFST